MIQLSTLHTANSFRAGELRYFIYLRRFHSSFLSSLLSFFFFGLFLFRSPFLSNSDIFLLTPLSFFSLSVYLLVSFELPYFTYAIFGLRLFLSFFLPFILPSCRSFFRFFETRSLWDAGVVNVHKAPAALKLYCLGLM